MTSAPPTAPSQAPPLLPVARSAPDAAMRRLLRIPDTAAPGGGGVGVGVGAGGRPRPDAHKAFSTSILVSATRCLLTYVLLPFLAPALGFASGVGPWIGLPLGVAAAAANVISIRRFWLAEHRWRWLFTALSTTVIVLLLVLIAIDLAELVD